MELPPNRCSFPIPLSITAAQFNFQKMLASAGHCLLVIFQWLVVTFGIEPKLHRKAPQVFPFSFVIVWASVANYSELNLAPLGSFSFICQSSVSCSSQLPQASISLICKMR
jgi:hypothetical protein